MASFCLLVAYLLAGVLILVVCLCIVVAVLFVGVVLLTLRLRFAWCLIVL